VHTIRRHPYQSHGVRRRNERADPGVERGIASSPFEGVRRRRVHQSTCNRRTTESKLPGNRQIEATATRSSASSLGVFPSPHLVLLTYDAPGGSNPSSSALAYDHDLTTMFSDEIATFKRLGVRHVRSCCERCSPRANPALFQVLLQALNFATVLATALMMWKGLGIITNTESPIVVVLSCVPSLP
jgi:hypothetical protein